MTRSVLNPEEYKNRDKDKIFNNWKDKRMYGQFFMELEGKDTINSWTWLKCTDPKGCTEALICSAKEQALRTNHIILY